MRSAASVQRFAGRTALGCGCVSAPPVTRAPTFALGEAFARHASWETGMVPNLADPLRRSPGSSINPDGSYGNTPLRRSPGSNVNDDGTLGWAADGSGRQIRRSSLATVDSLGALGLNVPVPTDKAGEIANATAARLMWIKRPSTRAFLRWESPTGEAPYIWRLHAPGIAQDNVRRILREVLSDKGSGDVTIVEVPGPDYDPATDLPGWHLKFIPPSLLPPPAPSNQQLSGDDGKAPKADDKKSSDALAQYGPAIFSLLNQAFEIDPHERAEVLQARIQNLEARKKTLPPFLQRYVSDRLNVLRARLKGAEYDRQKADESDQSTQRWRTLGQAGAGVGIFVGLAFAAMLLGVGRYVHQAHKKGARTSMVANSGRGGRRRWRRGRGKR